MFEGVKHYKVSDWTNTLSEENEYDYKYDETMFQKHLCEFLSEKDGKEFTIKEEDT
jgi:hypothetical protein